MPRFRAQQLLHRGCATVVAGDPFLPRSHAAVIMHTSGELTRAWSPVCDFMQRLAGTTGVSTVWGFAYQFGARAAEGSLNMLPQLKAWCLEV